MDGCVAYETQAIGQVVGYNISALAVEIASICTCGIIYIFVLLFRSIQEEHFRLYLGFCMFSVFALFSATVQRLLPMASSAGGASSRSYGIGLEVFLGAVISMQWIVQTGALFFLLIQNPGDRVSIRRVLGAALTAAICLLIPWTVSIALGRAFIGELLDEGFLVLLFSLSLWSSVRECSPCLPDSLRSERPMLRVWAGFMLAAHLLFLVMYTVRGVWPGSQGGYSKGGKECVCLFTLFQVGSCLYIVIDSSYYFCYPIVLMHVVHRDSVYWQEHGSLLLDMQRVMQQGLI